MRRRQHVSGIFIVQDQHDDRGRAVRALRPLNQREGAVLERAAGVALCVEVRDLLDFQRAFVRDGLAVPVRKPQRNTKPNRQTMSTMVVRALENVGECQSCRLST